MKTNITLTIQKRSQPERLLWLLILLPFCFGVLNELLGLPWAIRYLLDGVLTALLILMLRFHRSIDPGCPDGLRMWVGLFLVYTLLVSIVQYQSALYYLWGLRNNFRFYLAFFAFAAFLTGKDAAHYLKLLDRLFWINAAVSLFQYAILGLQGDYLGGIFGTEKGVNAYTNLFFLIITMKSILAYLHRQETLRICLAKCAAAVLIAAMAELKFFFLEFALVIGLSVLFTDFTWRKFWVLLGGAGAVAAGIRLIGICFPGLSDWFSLKNIWQSASSRLGYTASGDLNRFNGIAVINRKWLTGWGQRIFGLGLGNCDTSSFAFLNTPFYEAYSHTHYTWMSYAIVYLETGYIGLVFYFGFFAACFLAAVKMQRRNADPLFCRMAKIMAVCCMFIGIYNASLRGEAGYMAYFVLALPYTGRNNYD